MARKLSSTQTALQPFWKPRYIPHRRQHAAIRDIVVFGLLCMFFLVGWLVGVVMVVVKLFMVVEFLNIGWHRMALQNGPQWMWGGYGRVDTIPNLLRLFTESAPTANLVSKSQFLYIYYFFFN